ncbi:12402_t:CDS:2 [Funneliformis geosporum]|uniref:Ribosomal RNA-processing protein 8 n=1 Tax=Funneliformis geosporum TaxID=1117311 RepID=A0A9W4SN86_9GLOM|nr:7967_t:CDS:2 [Funneliformis geosporum]CAI2175958.1 12402_t:CDS:2 [Funneliformis geosporum]
MSTNLFEVPGWKLGKVVPQKEQRNKKRKITQEQELVIKKKKLNNGNNKECKINNANHANQKEKFDQIKAKKDQINKKNKKTKSVDKNEEPKQPDKDNSRKSNDLKNYAAKRQKKEQVGQKKKQVKLTKSGQKNTENPFADADNFDLSEEGTGKIIPQPEKPKNKKQKGNLDKMKKKLSEGKFRWINEQLYTTTGSKALEMFQKDPHLFDEYHDGFRSAVESWPDNPVDILLSYLKQKSKEIVVADLGCGEGKIGLEAPNKVLSFDLIAKHDKVIACDIAKLPIPDSFFDVVIFCLSLMGTNYVDFLKEAYRVLKPSGELKIAEVVSRFSDINSFIEVLAELGFKLIKKDDTNIMFIMLDFVKTNPRKTKKSKLYNSKDLLKPCVYKKR